MSRLLIPGTGEVFGGQVSRLLTPGTGEVFGGLLSRLRTPGTGEVFGGRLSRLLIPGTDEVVGEGVGMRRGLRRLRAQSCRCTGPSSPTVPQEVLGDWAPRGGARSPSPGWLRGDSSGAPTQGTSTGACSPPSRTRPQSLPAPHVPRGSSPSSRGGPVELQTRGLDLVACEVDIRRVGCQGV